MDDIECHVLSNGRTVQFMCGHGKTCCGTQCCDDGGPFYMHWYFWLAVCMFLMVVIGFGISAIRHFRRERRLQQCCVRNKREIGSDLLLNYHLMRTDLLHLPMYDDVFAAPHYTVNPLISDSSFFTPIPSPPPYTPSDKNVTVTITPASDPPTTPNDPPPSYRQSLIQTEFNSVIAPKEEVTSHSVISPSTNVTSRSEWRRLFDTSDCVQL